MNGEGAKQGTVVEVKGSRLNSSSEHDCFLERDKNYNAFGMFSEHFLVCIISNYNLPRFPRFRSKTRPKAAMETCPSHLKDLKGHLYPYQSWREVKIDTNKQHQHGGIDPRQNIVCVIK